MKPYYEHAGVTIYHGDSREILPDLPSVRLVVTDPPYVFGIASSSQEGKAGGWGDMMNAASWYAGWLTQCQRLTLHKDGAAWVFNSWRSFPVLARGAYESRWPITSLLVWDKRTLGPGGQQGLRPSYELIALFAQPEFAIANRGLPDIWQESNVSQRQHPAQKPLNLCRRLIRESGGGIVLDPFCGSGTTLEAAKAEGCEAIGIEIEERYCEIAAKRADQEIIAFD